MKTREKMTMQEKQKRIETRAFLEMFALPVISFIVAVISLVLVLVKT